MGRKSKRKNNLAPDEPTKAEKREILRCCTQVVELALTPFPHAPAEQWDQYMQIYTLIEKIRKKQQDIHVKFSNRQEHFDNFFEWLHENGVSTDSVKITDYDEGHGLEATQDIKINDEVTSIPRKLMITDQDALESPLGELIRTDKLLKGMPNVSLAVFLVSEKLKPDSFWKPYIDILPETYTLPLYYSPEELQKLQGSPALVEALKQFKHIARQFAYLYKVFNQLDKAKLQMKDQFTYDLYRWAAATVMSRQNQIPTRDGHGISLSLIPLWDMINHTNGQITTDFKEDSCVSMALKDFSAGEQVYICYGRRSNADMLLYSGFTYLPNANDSMTVQLGLSSSDRLYAMKAQLCAVMRLGVPSQNYHISKGDDPVSLELLTFLRIFCMTEEELRERLMGEERTQALFKLVDRNQIVSKLNERRICVYLATRVQLLQRQYKSTIEEDEEKLKSEKLNAHERSVIELLLAEKRILDDVLAYCALWREKAEDLPEDATCYESEKKEEEAVAENWEERDEEEGETEGQKDGQKEGGVGDGENSIENGDGMSEGAKEEKSTVRVNGDEMHNGEKPKVNGDVIPENGHSDVQVSELVEDIKQVAINGGTKSPVGELSNNNTAAVLKSKLNGNGPLIPDGNGTVHQGGEEARTVVVTKKVNSMVGESNGALENGAKRPNGHIPILGTNGTIKE